MHVEFIRGSTTQAGNDNYSFSLPTGSYQSFRMSGSDHYLDASLGGGADHAGPA